MTDEQLGPATFAPDEYNEGFFDEVSFNKKRFWASFGDGRYWCDLLDTIAEKDARIAELVSFQHNYEHATKIEREEGASELAAKDKRIAELESIREKYLMLCAVHSTPSDFCIQTACRVGDDALTFLMEWEERIKKPFLEKIARLTAELRNASAETACCIKFLETELFWEDFRAEGFIGKDAASASTRNCQKLAAFLKERGNHGAQLLAELAEANRKLELMPALEAVSGETSDGYHTFNELYEHRITLWIALCKQTSTNVDPDSGAVWRSKLHSDGTAFDGWFILGMGYRQGCQMTYHLPDSKWKDTAFARTLQRAPRFDGHTSSDVLERIKRIL